MVRKFLKFWKAEDGAVTVDWVVLTAGLVGFGILVIGSVQSASTSLGTDIGSYVSAQSSLLD